MQKAFIVRPFGVKEGVDFDAVEAELIVPALKQAGMDGSTTTEIFEAGNIREDMFRLLVTADVVVADVSIHNANVFYELGVRHAVRPWSTVLLFAEGGRLPFDVAPLRATPYRLEGGKQGGDGRERDEERARPLRSSSRAR